MDKSHVQAWTIIGVVLFLVLGYTIWRNWYTITGWF